MEAHDHQLAMRFFFDFFVDDLMFRKRQGYFCMICGEKLLLPKKRKILHNILHAAQIIATFTIYYFFFLSHATYKLSPWLGLLLLLVTWLLTLIEYHFTKWTLEN